ncbi:hypothetical protein Golax_018036, partial [Gossypium laxum]|nr:hypothetical protein [Gossypium laxum]
MMGSGDPGVECLMRTVLWVLDAIESRRGGPQKFNFHLLLMHQLKVGKDPMVVPLVTMDFWVLVYDLPHGFMSEMEKQDPEFGWDISLRIPAKREATQSSIWLREDARSKGLVEGMASSSNFGAMLSRPDGRHGNLILECLSFGEPPDCLSPLARGPFFGWKQNCCVSLRSYLGSHIHILINEDSDGKCWRCTRFYGALKELRR